MSFKHRGARSPHQKDREGGDSDHDQRQGGGRVQRSGADWGVEEIEQAKSQLKFLNKQNK